MKTGQRVRKGLIVVSMLLFPVTFFYFSPALIIVGAARGAAVGSFIVFAVLLVGSLLLGRAFCGRLCPGSGIQEACMLARDKRARGGRLDWIKWLIWMPWISVIVYLFIQAGGLGSVEPFYQTRFGFSLSDLQSNIIFLLFTGLIVVLALTAGRRAFCHYVCAGWLRS